MGILTSIYWIFLASVPYCLYVLTWEQLLISYIMFWFLGDCVHGLFLHRYAAHKLWNPPVWLQNVLTMFSVGSLTGTPITWSAWHRTHHHYADTPKDPHSPKYCSVPYMIFMSYYHYAEPKRCIDLFRNKFVAHVTKYIGIYALSINLILLSLLGLEMYLYLWVLPSAMTNAITNYGINVMCHQEDGIKNRPILYPLIFNETHHKNHHIKPELRYYKFDIWVSLITLLGWTNERSKKDTVISVT